MIVIKGVGISHSKNWLDKGQGTVKNSSPWLCLDCCSSLCLSRSHYLGFDSMDIKKVEYFVFISHTAPNSFVVCAKGVLRTVPSLVHWNASRTAAPFCLFMLYLHFISFLYLILAFFLSPAHLLVLEIICIIWGFVFWFVGCDYDYTLFSQKAIFFN